MLRSFKNRLISASVILIIAVVFLQIIVSAQPSGNNGSRPELVATPTPMLPENLRKEEETRLESISAGYNTKWNRYRAAYLACVIGAALLSGLAGLLLQLSSTKDKPRIKDVAAILAFAAAFLITLNTLGGFNTAGLANRVARNEIRKLKVAVMKGQITDRGEIESKIIEIEATKGDAAIGKQSE